MNRVIVRRFAPALLAAGLIAAASPAAAAPPDDNTFSIDFEDCASVGIPIVEGEVTGKAKLIETGAGDFISTSPGTKITLTNPGNGKTVSYVITGAFHVSEDAEGNTVYKATGRNLLTRTLADQGIYITVGNVSFVVDEDGNIVEEFALDGPGRVIDVCAALA